MRLSGAIIDHFANHVDCSALRGSLGTGKMFAYDVPQSVSMPYVVVTFGETTLQSKGKDNSWEVRIYPVVFDVWSKTPIDSLLDDVETGFLDSILTIDEGTMMAPPHLSFRVLQYETDTKIYHGTVELEYMIEKTFA